MQAPNIILIGLDTVRADHLGCYGYSRPTTPNLDRLAAEGLLFEDVHANHFPTIPSFTTLFTGLDGCDHQIVRQTMGPWYELPVPLLAERLLGRGYFTAAIDNLVTLRSGVPGWFARGYLQYLGFRYDPSDRSQARWITDRALTVIERVKPRPFFLFVHYWDAHNPYWPPGDAPSFEVAPVRPGEPTLFERFTAEGDEVAALTVESMQMKEVTNYDYVVAQYDRSLWNLDREVGRLLDGLGALDRDTLVMAIGDHGECFGEFGAHFDHAGPSDANTHVPLLLRWPGTIAPGRRAGLFDTVDAAVTLAAAGGLPPNAGSDGRDLLTAPPPRDYVVSAECTRQADWILRTRDWKLVDPAIDPAGGEPYLDLMGRPRGGPTLYQVGQETDVSAQHPDEHARLTQLLRGRLAERLRGRPDPLSAQGPLSHAALLERIRRH